MVKIVVKIVILAVTAILVIASAVWIKQEYYSSLNDDGSDDSQILDNGSNNSTMNETTDDSVNNTDDGINYSTISDNTNTTQSISNETDTCIFNVTYTKINTSQYYFPINKSNSQTDIFRYLINWTVWNNTIYSSIGNFKPDFNNYSYSIIYWGEMTTGGYAIDYTNVIYDNGSLCFYYSKDYSGDFVTMVITEPNSLIQIPRDQFTQFTINEVHYYYDPSTP